MATRNRAMIAVKRALDKQSWGGKKGRFAVQRSLEHLKQNPIFLNDDVKAIKLNLRPPESVNQGAKQFLFENVPQLRYNNPNIEITRTKNRLGDAAVHIYFADGKEEKVLTQEKTNIQILNDLARLASKQWVPTSEDKEQEGDNANTDTADQVGNENHIINKFEN